jgi:microsomal dipeptidase-like Zn-dependent dipeptidase
MKKYQFFVLIALTGLVIFFTFAPRLVDDSANVVLPHQVYSISEPANQLHKTLLIGDWHADSLLWTRDLGKEMSYGHLDIPRMQRGNIGLQMFTTVTKSPMGLNNVSNQADSLDSITLLAVTQRWPLATWNSLAERALYQGQKLHELIARESDNVMLITSQSKLREFVERRTVNPDFIGALLGTEGSHALEGDLDNIQRLFDKGFRMMSLQHFFDNKLGGSLHGISGDGLTSFGREAVGKMTALGIMLDVSHSSEKVVAEVLALTDRPLLISHTGFQGHCLSPRNISDSLMQDIAEEGGLIAVGYWDSAICGTSPATVAQAIIYGINLVGEDHVALGSDFDGSVTTAFDGGELPAVTHELLKAGVTETQVRKVMGLNMLGYLQRNLPL